MTKRQRAEDNDDTYLNEVLILPDGRVAFKHVPKEIVAVAVALNPVDPSAARLSELAREEVADE